MGLDRGCSTQGESALFRNWTLLQSPYTMYSSRARHSCTNHQRPVHEHDALYTGRPLFLLILWPALCWAA